MKTLKPIYDRKNYSFPVAMAIYSLLYAEIFAPLFEILEIPKSKQNALTTALEEALRSGRIFYEDGFFLGELNSTISKQIRAIGGKYNRTRKAYKLEPAKLPVGMKLAIAQAHAMAQDKLKKVEDFLRAIEARKLKKIDLEPMFGKILDKLDVQFHTTTRNLTGKDVEIGILPGMAEKLKEEYTENLDKYIKNWHDEQVLRLRAKVTENVAIGFRAEKMIDSIVQERGVTFSKAKFLAKQETSLLVSKYRELRYEEIGIRKYRWSTSHDERVRPDHRELNGEVFRFDQPPITDKKRGARNNPGEDFGCRCIAIPLLPTSSRIGNFHVAK